MAFQSNLRRGVHGTEVGHKAEFEVHPYNGPMLRRSLALLIFTVAPAFAFAHGLGVKATRTGDTVRVEAFFDSDDPAEDSEVTVTAADGRVVAKGMTDAKGIFTFQTPEPCDYLIVADAGSGHRAKTTLKISASSNEAVRVETGHPLKWLGIAVGLIVIAVGTTIWKRSRTRVVKAL